MSEFFIPDPAGQIPSADGYFGAFGGKFIPEALVAAVDEVAVEYDKAKADPTKFQLQKCIDAYVKGGQVAADQAIRDLLALLGLLGVLGTGIGGS